MKMPVSVSLLPVVPKVCLSALYLPLLNVFIFVIYLWFMFYAGSGIFALYASAFYLIPGTITILVLLVAFNLIFCFLFRLCVVLLRKTAFFINRFY